MLPSHLASGCAASRNDRITQTPHAPLIADAKVFRAGKAALRRMRTRKRISTEESEELPCPRNPAGRFSH